MKTYLLNFEMYCKLEQLSDCIREKHNINATTPRFDCTATTGYFKPLVESKNKKGQLYMYLCKNDGVINADQNRMADNRLQLLNGQNFTSVYLLEDMLELDGKTYYVGYGTPNGHKTLKNGKKNLFYDYRGYGYILLVSKDFKSIEVLVMCDGKNVIQGIAKSVAEGLYNKIIQNERACATPIYDYWE